MIHDLTPTIRDEEADDAAAVRLLHRRAFGLDLEANLVEALHANGAVTLALVATVEARVVGHILFSPIRVGDVIGAALGPMAVAPDHQRRGIGGQLVMEGITRLRRAAVPYVIVLGHTAFYPRFGFRPASTYGITCEWPVPDEVFMALVLDPTRVTGATGLARYRPEFHAGS
jgi:putative acetyltransferase